MTYSDAFNIRTTSVKFNDVADAIDGTLTRSYVSTTTGTSTAYIATPSPAWLSYTDAPFIIIVPHVDNSSGSGTTINVSSLGAKSIKRAGVNISAGALKASTPAFLIYNSSGGYFELLITENTIRQDGTNSPTANINWGGYKITNLGNGTAAGDAINLGQLQAASGFYLDTVNNRVGINQTSPAEKLHLNGAIRLDASAAPAFDSGTRFWAESAVGARYDSKSHRFDVGNGPARVQALTIQDGPQMLINTTTQMGSLLNLVLGTLGGTNDQGIAIKAAAAGNYGLGFQNSSGTAIGRIQLDAAGTQYVTTSDYRLKEDIKPMLKGLDKTLQLKPCTWKWKSGAGNGQGFIAHELAEIIPEAVSGEKDAVDSSGNIRPQGVDTGYIVATLVAAIQELSAKVEALEVQNGNRG